MKAHQAAWSLSALVVLVVLVLAACGGGGRGVNSAGTPLLNSGVATTSGAAPNAMSSGAITAFGSVFVNNHEFDVSQASVIDDDTGNATTSTTTLEVGKVVDVRAAANSSDSNPVAQALHIHPLARGYVDASSTGAASTITVMGQTVQISSTTLFSDHRTCVTASSSPCTAISAQSGLSTTTGSGSSAIAGSYVTVDGFLFNSGSGSGVVNIVAALVAVSDAPANTNDPAAYKVEGEISAISGTTLTIGGLSVNLASAACFAAGASTPCSSFSVGQIVSTFTASSPALPVTTMNASDALLRNRLPVETVGATVEVEGSVSAVSASPAGFTLRGIAIDATALPAGTSLPATGDVVSVLGTVESSGSIGASSIRILRAARSASYAFEGDASSVAAGSASGTYVLGLMGQTIGVSAQTRFADRTQGFTFGSMASGNPFNINTFQTYLAASTSQHLVVNTAADASGNLQALSVLIVPASTVAGVAGEVDTSPAPVNSASSNTPTAFSIHGVPVSASTAAIYMTPHDSSTSIAAGDEVVALGMYSAGTLTVSAPASFTDFVVDSGPPLQPDCPGF